MMLPSYFGFPPPAYTARFVRPGTLLFSAAPWLQLRLPRVNDWPLAVASSTLYSTTAAGLPLRLSWRFLGDAQVRCLLPGARLLCAPFGGSLLRCASAFCRALACLALGSSPPPRGGTARQTGDVPASRSFCLPVFVLLSLSLPRLVTPLSYRAAFSLLSSSLNGSLIPGGISTRYSQSWVALHYDCTCLTSCPLHHMCDVALAFSLHTETTHIICFRFLARSGCVSLRLSHTLLFFSYCRPRSHPFHVSSARGPHSIFVSLSLTRHSRLFSLFTLPFILLSNSESTLHALLLPCSTAVQFLPFRRLLNLVATSPRVRPPGVALPLSTPQISIFPPLRTPESALRFVSAGISRSHTLLLSLSSSSMRICFSAFSPCRPRVLPLCSLIFPFALDLLQSPWFYASR